MHVLRRNDRFQKLQAKVAQNKNSSEELSGTISDETRKRITILPEKLNDDAKLILKRLFDPNLNEVDAKVANGMLVASSPKDSATARAAFIRSQQQHLSVTAVASVKKPAQRDKQVCMKEQSPSF